MSIRAPGRSAEGKLAILRHACHRNLLCILLMMISGASFGESGTDSREYQIKAAFLYNFMRFTEWPAGSFAEATSPIRVGTYCTGPFSGMLERLVANRAVNGRKIVVTQLAAAESAKSMHAVFICANGNAILAGIEDAVKASPVLTVSESDRSVPGNACIHFLVEAGRVRFEINMTACDRAGLRVSAQLQKLAKAVHRTR